MTVFIAAIFLITTKQHYWYPIIFLEGFVIFRTEISETVLRKAPKVSNTMTKPCSKKDIFGIKNGSEVVAMVVVFI